MQLIGITSLMIACKTEEILCPEVDDYVYICDNAYNSGKFRWGHPKWPTFMTSLEKTFLEEILKMELEIFHTLDFNVGQPMSISFLRRYSNMGGVEARQEWLWFLKIFMNSDWGGRASIIRRARHRVTKKLR